MLRSPASWPSDPLSLSFYLGVALLARVWFRMVAFNRRLNHIPAIGPTGILSSYVAAWNLSQARIWVQEGYEKYRTHMFRIPFIEKWVVVVANPQLINDLRYARDDELSFHEAVVETVQAKYTTGVSSLHDKRLRSAIQSPLTRKLGAQFHEVRDEIISAFEDKIALQDNLTWTPVPALNAVLGIVFRVNNRHFVGLPLCRDAGYADSTLEFILSILKTAFLINVFPRFLHPIIGPLVSPLAKGMRETGKYLRPIVEERIKMDDEYGKEGYERPDDLISWLLDEDAEAEPDVATVINQIFVANFSATHTTTQGLTSALYHLAASPEYVQPLREEIEGVIQEDGWSKSALSKARKLDSFIRESLRMNVSGAFTMVRVVAKDTGFTFSDGTTLPKGTCVAVPLLPIQQDEANYSDPLTFDGFRFANMPQQDKYQISSTNLDFVSFGHGRLACPGRFFAAYMLKAMLAHIIVTYDVKTEHGVRPPNQWYGTYCTPNHDAKILFRKRKD